MFGEMRGHASIFRAKFYTSIFLLLLLHETSSTRTSKVGSWIDNRALMLEDVASDLQSASDAWRRVRDPLFPFTRKPERVTQPTPLYPPPSASKQNRPRPVQAWLQQIRPGWLSPQNWFLNQAQQSAIQQQVTPNPIPAVITSAPAPAATTGMTEVECVCVKTASECKSDFILNPATEGTALVHRLSLHRGWDIPKCLQQYMLCCRLLSPQPAAESEDTQDNTLTRPPQQQGDSELAAAGVVASSCHCLPSTAACPSTHVALHLITCPGLTCCPAPPTPAPPAVETCHCVSQQQCPNPENNTRTSTFCQPPYTLCCAGGSQLVLQPSSSTINFPTPAPIALPTNRVCRCLTVASDCPEHGDILYGPDVIDIRNELSCSGFICCVEPTMATHPIVTGITAISSSERCACVDRVNECPVHFAVLPQFVGPQCGPPRVWCCPPDAQNDAPVATTPMTPSSQSSPWCQCAPLGTCDTLRVGGEIARDVCGSERMELCCKQNNSPTMTTLPPLENCRFSPGPAFPAEGTCSCTTRNHCRQPARFTAVTQGQCPSPLGWCCRSLDYCGGAWGNTPWLAAIEEASGRTKLCAALVVHRLAVLAPASCITGHSTDGLQIRFLQSGSMEQNDWRSAECGVRVAGVMQSRDLALLMLRDVPLAPEPPFSPACPPPRPAEAVDPGDCVLAATSSAWNATTARIQVSTSLQPSSTCGASQDEVCVGARRLQFRGDCSNVWRNGAALMCRVRGGGDRLALVALVTNEIEGAGTGVCGGFTQRATAARNSWLVDILEYLDTLQPSASWPPASDDNILFKKLGEKH